MTSLINHIVDVWFCSISFVEPVTTQFLGPNIIRNDFYFLVWKNCFTVFAVWEVAFHKDGHKEMRFRKGPETESISYSNTL